MTRITIYNAPIETCYQKKCITLAHIYVVQGPPWEEGILLGKEYGNL